MNEIEILSKQIQKDLDSGKAKSQAQIARGIGVEPQEITNWKARGKIPAEKQKLVCQYYSWSLDYLNTGKELTKVNESPGPYQATKVITWDNQNDLPANEYVFIPRYDVYVSAGNGSIAWTEIEKEKPQAFRVDFIMSGGFKADALKVIYVKGDSMEPRIYNGDSITIDTLQTTVINEKYYVIRIEDEIMVKKLRKRPGGGLEIISLNPAYAPMSLTPQETDHIKIIGRVVQISSMGDL